MTNMCILGMRWVIGATLWGALASSASGQHFYLIEPPSQPVTSYVVNGISADGRVAAIQCTAGTTQNGFVWSAASGLTALHASGTAALVSPTSLSDDGGSVAGVWGQTVMGTQTTGIFISPPSNQITPVFTTTTPRIAFAWMSGDARTIAGSVFASNEYAPYYWTQSTGIKYLDHLTQDTTEGGYLNAVSADGAVMVGGAASNSYAAAVRWDRNGHIYALPIFSDFLYAYTTADGVSRNGQFICGDHSGRTRGLVPVIWPLSGGVLELQRPEPYWNSYAYCISDDGQVAAGYALPSPPVYHRGLVWPTASYAVDGATYFNQHGATVPNRWVVWEIRAMSTDGKVMAGVARSLDTSVYAAFVADMRTCAADFNVDGGIDGSDVAAFFQSWESGEDGADVDENGGIDGHDVETFFVAWESGSCGW